jgi:lipopolysaccharide transport system permease protein
MTCWLMFYDGITAPFRAIEQSKQYFLRREISLSALLSSWMPERLFASLIQLAFCIVVVTVQMSTGVVNILGFVLFYACGALFFTCFGHLLAIIGMVSPSVLNFSDVTNRFLLFLSAVIFPLPSEGIAAVIQYANPYYVFIENARRILLDRGFDWIPVAGWLAVGALVACFLWLQLSKVEPDVRDFLQ